MSNIAPTLVTNKPLSRYARSQLIQSVQKWWDVEYEIKCWSKLGSDKAIKFVRGASEMGIKLNCGGVTRRCLCT